MDDHEDGVVKWSKSEQSWHHLDADVSVVCVWGRALCEDWVHYTNELVILYAPVKHWGKKRRPNHWVYTLYPPQLNAIYFEFD